MRAPFRPVLGLTTPVDLAVTVALAVAAGWETAAQEGATLLRTLLAVSTVVPLAARRVVPTMSAALVAIGLAAESFATESPDEAGVLLAVVLSAYSVAAHAQRRDAALGLGLLGMAVSGAIAVDPSDDASNILPTVALFVGIPAAVGFSFNRRGRALAASELRAEAAESKAAAARESERRRLARELHDIVSHAVTRIAVQAEAGQARLDHDPDGGRRALESISEASRDAVTELHAMLALLREPSALPPEAGLDALPALAAGVNAAGVRVAIDQPEHVELSPAVDLCAFRVIQEGLTNALRHARSTRVKVSIREADGSVEIRVQSFGRRAASAFGGSGHGIAGLRERAAAVGGTVEARAEGDAFVLIARLPAGAS